VHAIDVVRWGLGKNVHPVKIHCVGGFYADASGQETPNVQRMFTLSAECFIDRKALSSNGVFVARATFCA